METHPTVRTVLVTGSSDGIGRATAVELARRGYRVIVHGRSPARAEAARQEALRRSGNAPDLVGAVSGDLASLAEVRAMAAQIRERFERLDALINNAGVYLNGRQESRDGYELTLAVNHLAHFLLTLELLRLLESSAPSRIVVVSSMTHSSGDLDLEDLQMVHDYEGYRAYSRSKLANLLFAYALARRLEGTGITVNALHPGVIATKLLHASFSGGSPVERGAETPVYLATAPEVEGMNGRYFVDRREARSSAESHDQELQERLWALSERLVGRPATEERRASR